MKGGSGKTKQKTSTKLLKERMKMKAKKRILGLVLAVAMACGMNPASASAAESETVTEMKMVQTEGFSLEVDGETVFGGLYDVEGNSYVRTVMLSNCAIRMGYVDSSYLHIEFLTGASHDATEIGVKDIKVQEKVGIFWKTIATAPDGYATNTTGFVAQCNCYSAVLGETYRVSCTHYAYINGDYYSLDNVTDGHKFV